MPPLEMNSCATNHSAVIWGHGALSVCISCRTCKKHASWLRRRYATREPDFSHVHNSARRGLMGRWGRRPTGKESTTKSNKAKTTSRVNLPAAVPVLVASLTPSTHARNAICPMSG
eukprot:9458125-Pyramimonas_sp.AAC.1